MRRWNFETAPKDGSTIIGFTPVEGVDRLIRFNGRMPGGWEDIASGERLSQDRFVAWAEYARQGRTG
jgi:hypothetical protein